MYNTAYTVQYYTDLMYNTVYTVQFVKMSCAIYIYNVSWLKITSKETVLRMYISHVLAQNRSS